MIPLLTIFSEAFHARLLYMFCDSSGRIKWLFFFLIEFEFKYVLIPSKKSSTYVFVLQFLSHAVIPRMTFYSSFFVTWAGKRGKLNLPDQVDDVCCQMIYLVLWKSCNILVEFRFPCVRRRILKIKRWSYNNNNKYKKEHESVKSVCFKKKLLLQTVWWEQFSSSVMSCLSSFPEWTFSVDVTFFFFETEKLYHKSHEFHQWIFRHGVSMFEYCHQWWCIQTLDWFF